MCPFRYTESVLRQNQMGTGARTSTQTHCGRRPELIRLIQAAVKVADELAECGAGGPTVAITHRRAARYV